MQPAIDFVNARNGSVVIEELPSYLAFFNKYVTAAQAVRIASLHTDCIHSAACFRLSAPNSTSAPVSSIVASTLWLYKSLNGFAGETSVVPAWRDAIWHLLIKWQFQYNDTLADRITRYQTLSAHIQ